MVDSRHMEFVWDSPTKIYKEAERYFKHNSKAKDYKDAVAVPDSRDIGALVHNLAGEYHSGVAPPLSAYRYFKDRCLHLCQETNGLRRVIFNDPWRIDLEPMNLWLHHAFGRNTGFGFDNPDMDGEDETAEAYVWFGYYRAAQSGLDIRKYGIDAAIAGLGRRKNVLNTKSEDCRVSFEDLAKIIVFLKGEQNDIDVCAVNTGFLNPEDPFNSVVSEAMPESFLSRWGRSDRLGQFAPYSYLRISGVPSEVRASIINFLSICYNEKRVHFWKFGDEHILESPDLSCVISSQNLKYVQKKVRQL